MRDAFWKGGLSLDGKTRLVGAWDTLGGSFFPFFLSFFLSFSTSVSLPSMYHKIQP